MCHVDVFPLVGNANLTAGEYMFEPDNPFITPLEIFSL